MVKKYIKRFRSQIQRQYRQDPYATVVLYGLFLGMLFSIFAFRGLIAAIFLPEIDVKSKEEVAQENQNDEKLLPATYETKDDDTIYSVAAKFNIPWTRIAELNDLEPPYELEEGQQLKLKS